MSKNMVTCNSNTNTNSQNVTTTLKSFRHMDIKVVDNTILL